MATIIMNCNCSHKYQDTTYGKGQRVFNSTVKDETYRCTVCSTLRSAGSAEKTAKK